MTVESDSLIVDLRERIHVDTKMSPYDQWYLNVESTQ